MLDNRVAVLDNNAALDNMGLSYSGNAMGRFSTRFRHISSLDANDHFWADCDDPVPGPIRPCADSQISRKTLTARLTVDHNPGVIAVGDRTGLRPRKLQRVSQRRPQQIGVFNDQ